MGGVVKNSYRFAFRSSLIISLVGGGFLGLVLWGFNLFLIVPWFISTLGFFLISFLIIQSRVQKFIYRRIKRIYDEFSLIETSGVSRPPITTDMKTLTEEIEKFAKGKKTEIDTLKVQEAYRRDFLGNVSHELKTPLFTVQGYILTLLDGAMNDEKVLEKYLKRANKGVERLIYIVKDLDMMTKLEVGNLNIIKKPFDIIDLITNTFDLLEMRAAKKQIVLSLDKDYEYPVLVYADEEKIQQVLTNLLVNAIKYGQQNGTAEVSIEPLIKNKLLVRVTDNGEGIQKEHIPRLFERFYRVDQSGSRKEGGSGLGLSIVKHIIEAHGEKIYVESELHVGSEFSFTLESANGSTFISDFKSSKSKKS